MKRVILSTIVAATLIAQCVQAAFIVEPIAGGKAYANYAYTGAGGTAASVTALGGLAPGLSGINSSIFGGNGTTDQYTFSYTPGTDADNTTFTAGQWLGDNFGTTNYASGVIAGASGDYNVYATWVVSANIGSPTTVPNLDFYVSSDGPLLHPATVNQNTGNTGTPGGNAGWFYLGTVSLTAGNTYTVVWDSIVDNFVSMRSAGVMWEPVLVPEPSTLVLSIAGGLALLGLSFRRRNR